MRKQLLSLAFGLAIITPVTGIGCDDDGEKHASADKSAQVEPSDTNRQPADKSNQDQKSDDNRNSPRRELFARPQFWKF